MWLSRGVPGESSSFRVKKERVAHSAPCLTVAVGGSSLPCDFIAEHFRAENAIHKYFEIVACCRIAMQIETSCCLQDAMQFHQPDGHHGQISHHVALFEKCPQRSQQLGNVAVPAFHHIVKGSLRAVIPVPCIFKGFNLSLRFLTTVG